MELPELGEHCSLVTCKQLDFLPFTCDACRKIYCREHVKYDDHQCQAAQNKDRRVPVCPLCNQPISLSPTESADRKVNEHIENDCKSDLAKHKRSNKCNAKGCKQRELIPVLCVSCKLNFCLRHRHENDHVCITKTGNNSKSSAAGTRAGQAATSRFTSNQTKPKTTRNEPRRTQQSSLNSIGSDLSRQRQVRQTNQTSMQPTNMSEDQALALALQASLSDPPPSSSSKPSSTKPLTEQEKADAALARALEQSEKEKRERQQRQQRQQQNTKKDGCILS